MPRRLLKPGGTLVYSTCSLELEEGEAQIAAPARPKPGVRRSIRSRLTTCLGRRIGYSPRASCRTFPYQLDLGTPEWSGMDGFFAARLNRNE